MRPFCGVVVFGCGLGRPACFWLVFCVLSLEPSNAFITSVGGIGFPLVYLTLSYLTLAVPECLSMFLKRRFCVGAPHCRRPTTHPAPSPLFVWALRKTERPLILYSTDQGAEVIAKPGRNARNRHTKEEQEQNMGSTDDMYVSLPCSAPCVECEKELCGLEGRCLFIPSLVCFFQALTWSLFRCDAGARSPTVNPSPHPAHIPRVKCAVSVAP